MTARCTAACRWPRRRATATGGALIVALHVILPAVAAGVNCPEAGGELLFHSCHGAASAELLLLPEETDALTRLGASEVLIVSGAYTGADRREGGLPNPVGLFIDQGRVISPNLARMDGILVIGADRQPRILHAARVPFGGEVFDLVDPNQRFAFADRTASEGVSVMQSHLLIDEGRIDVSPQEGAPSARRRMLFSGSGGWGIYQTAGAVTLHEATRELQERFRPDMALNLDMGSYDFCLTMREGTTRNCGVVAVDDTAKLSNALRFVHTTP